MGIDHVWMGGNGNVTSHSLSSLMGTGLYAITVSICSFVRVCVSVRLSVSLQSRTCEACTKTTEPINVKFRTVLGPRKLITGCSIVTLSQIQDGGLPLIWQSLSGISQWKMVRLWWHLVHWMRWWLWYKWFDSTEIQILNTTRRTDAILENIVLAITRQRQWLVRFSWNFVQSEDNDGQMWKMSNFKNPRGRGGQPPSWQESLANAKVSARQQCVYEGP